MFLCSKMFGKFTEVLKQAGDVLAPPCSALDDFEYHWKTIKNFYTIEDADQQLPKVHVNDTNIPMHLEQMLQLIIKEDVALTNTDVNPVPQKTQPPSKTTPCLNFVLTNRPLDLLVELAVNDQPPGIKQIVLNWIRRLLSCLDKPPIDHVSLFQPLQKLIGICDGHLASPYENEEILFLETVAGFVRKEENLINIFLEAHQHSAEASALVKGLRSDRPPINNTLFQATKLEPNIRRVSLMPDERKTSECSEDSSSCNGNGGMTEWTDEKTVDNIFVKCDCEEGDRFGLFDAIFSYFDSADSTIIVRCCESILILASLPSLNRNCCSINSSLTSFCVQLTEKIVFFCQQIPEDMDLQDIEEMVISWGLHLKDDIQPHFVGRFQLMAFLCWLDYCDTIVRECIVDVGIELSQLLRQKLFEEYLEPGILDIYAGFMLVLTSKIVKQIRSEHLMEELATWLVGEKSIDKINGTDCLLTIIIENAQDNPEILLQTLQFVESLLDNPNERILHSMIFYYLNQRGYCDNSAEVVQCWSDEEENRERRRGSAAGPIKSRTLAPNNILKIINHFLLLLPRQIMSDTIGTCYEDYLNDASRHYQTWICKTQKFNWPVEAVYPDEDLSSPEHTCSTSTDRPKSLGQRMAKINLEKTSSSEHCGDSGISEDSFYEGSLLRLLFTQLRQMTSQPYELNLAVIAILSKLAFLPHPYLHEILLNPELPVAPHSQTLWTVLQALSRQLLTEIPRIEQFQQKIIDTAKRLLLNPPLLKEVGGDSENDAEPDTDSLFETIVVLEEFCKELAAIAFIKFHHATE